MNTLEAFLQNPPFLSDNIRKLWQSIYALEDSFDSHFDSSKKRIETTHVQLPFLHSQTPYLPIECLRGDESSKLFQGKSVDRFFLSSGTTAETRSVSNFSHDGLLLYKAQSLKTFRDVMLRFFGEDALKIPGVSLIPSIKEWPTSSLAQMLVWISEFWDVKKGTPDCPFLKGDSRVSPFWLFATPFQLIDLFDKNFSYTLPKGSVVFETGGTKGKTRDVQRDELYSLISERFQIPQESIISEYGMCELACQAYDFAIPNQTRRFRFPTWVSTSVLPGLGLNLKEGEGALLIDDSLRIDYPWALRTQDVGRLQKDGSFEILGRVPRAVLKGCSLLTETEVPKTKKHKTKLNQITKSIQVKVPENLPDLVLNPQALEALSIELGSKSAAQSAFADLQSSFSGIQWDASVRNSKAVKGEHWFFILPNNHSLAGVYPLVLGTFAGLNMTVRIPSAFQDKNSFLQIILRQLEMYASITSVSSEFRLGKDPFPKDVDKLFIFGDDETIQSIQHISPVPISSFGSGITVSVLRSLSENYAAPLAKDMLSLGQRGCMSSRALFVSSSWDQVPAFLRAVERECKNFWQSEWTTMQKVAVDHETLALQKRGFEIFERESFDDVLFPIFRMDQRNARAEDLLSAHPFVFPILFYGENSEKMISDLNTFPSLICVSTNENFSSGTFAKNIRVCKLGHANSPAWDGLQNSKPLFG